MEEFHNFKQLNQLCHILIKNNPFTLVNNQNNQSMNEIIRSDEKFFFLFHIYSQQIDIKTRYHRKSNVFLYMIYFSYLLLSFICSQYIIRFHLNQIFEIHRICFFEF